MPYHIPPDKWPQPVITLTPEQRAKLADMMFKPPAAMALYEITNGLTGESYIRCYVWAESREHAFQLAGDRHKQLDHYSKWRCQKLFDANAEPFATEWSDSGFPE